MNLLLQGYWHYGTADNEKSAPAATPELMKEELLTQAREYTRQFKLETLREEDLIRLQYNAYKQAI